MWKHIRTTLLILLAGTLIGILVGNLSVSGRPVGRGRTSGAASGDGMTEVAGQIRSSGAQDTPYGLSLAYEEEGVADGGGSYRDLQEERKAAGLTDAAVAARMEAERGHYCYDSLEEEQQRIYAEILMILELHGDEILVSAKETGDLSLAFLCVFQDHPEIYWCDGYHYRRYERGLGSNVYTFGGRYTYTPEECERYETKIDDYVRSCLRGLPSRADQYETVRYIYEYVILHTDYEPGAKDDQNILSVMLYGKSVCQGYAKAVQYLCREAGIPATLVVGRVFGDSEGHAWDLVRIDGAYYYLDATWGDAGFLVRHGEREETEAINYRYLNVTSEDLAGTHIFENPVAMPYCVSTEANYYVREGLYLTDYDTGQLRRMFSNAAADGSRSVSFKIADDDLYREVRERLIERQEVVGLIPSQNGQISYSEDAGLRILTFRF